MLIKTLYGFFIKSYEHFSFQNSEIFATREEKKNQKHPRKQTFLKIF